MRSEHSKLLAVSKAECKGNVLPLTNSENTVLPNKYKKILLSSLKTTINHRKLV